MSHPAVRLSRLSSPLTPPDAGAHTESVSRRPACRAAIAGPLLAAGLGLTLSLALSAPAHAQAEDAAMDAVGVTEADGSLTTYSDPFCAGYAVAFAANGGDKALTPECPEEPVEPLSLSGHAKGERAGKASAQAYLQFKKQQDALRQKRPDQVFLPGFYDKSRDIWSSSEPGMYRATSFDGGRYAVVNKEDVGLGVVDKTGALIVPVEYPQIGFEQGETFITVQKDGKAGVFDGRGKMLVPARYERVLILDKNYLIALNNGRNEVYDPQGNVLFTLDKDVIPAGEGLFWFMQEPQRWGLVDSSGKPVVKPEFTYTSSFQKGKLTSQKSDGENYTIFANGKVVKQP
ncbi:WG repeat-containing protein [Pseudomonadota bacterium AL_CKDN230030165-1A_HGKHYDSX7]